MKTPQINDAKTVVKKYELDGAIILWFKEDNFGYSEYGKNKAACDSMHEIADMIFAGIKEGIITVADLDELAEILR